MKITMWSILNHESQLKILMCTVYRPQFII
jgi:hypothetical protein